MCNKTSMQNGFLNQSTPFIFKHRSHCVNPRTLRQCYQCLFQSRSFVLSYITKYIGYFLYGVSLCQRPIAVISTHSAPSLHTSLKQKDQNTEGKITKAKKGYFSRDLSRGILTRQEKNQKANLPWDYSATVWTVLVRTRGAVIVRVLFIQASLRAARSISKTFSGTQSGLSCMIAPSGQDWRFTTGHRRLTGAGQRGWSLRRPRGYSLGGFKAHLNISRRDWSDRRTCKMKSYS